MLHEHPQRVLSRMTCPHEGQVGKAPGERLCRVPWGFLAVAGGPGVGFLGGSASFSAAL